MSNGVWFVRIGKSVKSAKSGFNTSPFSEIKNIGLLGAKVPRFSLESTDVSIKEVRCFRFPVPILFPREAVSVSPLLKKFYENILHFLHHKGKCIVIIDDFGCRIGCRMRCRIALQGVGTPRFHREIDKITAEKGMISCQNHKETARH